MRHPKRPEYRTTNGRIVDGRGTTSSHCSQCGMSAAGNEFHPFAVCLMFQASKDSRVVEANLNALMDTVEEWVRRDMAPTPLSRAFRPTARRRESQASASGGPCIVAMPCSVDRVSRAVTLPLSTFQFRAP